MSEISVIVPIYKVPEVYLRRCIEGMINQSFEDIEIILVDDGSPDHCGKICDEYGAKDTRVNVMHTVNGGLSAARNIGVRAASSKWIMFVDGDDWLDTETCKVIIETARKYDPDVVMFGMKKDYNHTSIEYKYLFEPYRIYEGDDCIWLQEQILNYNSNIATATTKLIKRDLLIKNDIFHKEELRQGAEGIEFNLRLFKEVKKAIYVPFAGYHYIYNELSITSTYDEQNYKYIIQCFQLIDDEVEDYENKEKLKKWIDNRMIYVIVTTAISGYFSPDNKDSYKVKVKKFRSFLDNSLCKRAIGFPNLSGVTTQRKIIFMLIKYRQYYLIQLVAGLRKIQKKIR